MAWLFYSELCPFLMTKGLQLGGNEIVKSRSGDLHDVLITVAAILTIVSSVGLFMPLSTYLTKFRSRQLSIANIV